MGSSKIETDNYYRGIYFYYLTKMKFEKIGIDDILTFDA